MKPVLQPSVFFHQAFFSDIAFPDVHQTVLFLQHICFLLMDYHFDRMVPFASMGLLIDAAQVLQTVVLRPTSIRLFRSFGV
jgi:hypothetical protein